jgi:hypothetical protein
MDVGLEHPEGVVEVETVVAEFLAMWEEEVRELLGVNAL